MPTGPVQTALNQLGLHTKTSLDMQVTMECNLRGMQSPMNSESALHVMI